MRTKLEQLTGDTISEIQDNRRARRLEHGFGWVRIDYPKSPQQLCMVAWVPGYRQTEYGLWPVYTASQGQPDLDGKTSWQWDGDAEEPTLSPSILHYTEYGGQRHDSCHGYVVDGGWESC